MSKYQDCKTKPALANIYPICIHICTPTAHAHSGSVYKQEFCHGIAHQAFGISCTVYISIPIAAIIIDLNQLRICSK
jgi:hypothetical protein